jgi:L-cysteine/cystine lyase
VVTPFLPDDEKLAAVRVALPATSAGIYLDTPSRGPIPAEVHRAMTELAEWELAFGRGSAEYRLETVQRMDEARAAVAAVGVADPDAIALVHSIADALDLATRLVDWRPGDRVVTCGVDPAVEAGPLRVIHDRLGVELAAFGIARTADDDGIVAGLEEAIVPGTRLVWIGHVAATTGTLLPIARIVELAHSRGALVAVDGGQAFGAIPVDLGRLGADIYAIPGATWLLGPDGIGAVHVGPAVLDRARARAGIGFGPGPGEGQDQGRGRLRTGEDGTVGHHGPSITGFARSVAWLSMYVGWGWIHTRSAGLAGATARRLAAIDGVDVRTPLDRMATVLAFAIRGWSADGAGEELAKRTFAILGTLPAIGAVRIGVGFFNSEDELERFAAGVELLAGHTPETLPPRQLLTILGQD